MKRILFSFLFVFISIQIFSESADSIEKVLLPHIKKINHWQHQQKKKIYPLDSLMSESRTLKKLLLDYTTQESGTFSYPFDSLRKYIDIVTSDDGKLRIYSWHAYDKESMQFYNNVFQYEANGQIYATQLTPDDEFNPKGTYSDIETLKRDSDVIYLAYFHAFYSPKDYAESYETFSIQGTTLQDSIPIFKTAETGKSVTSSLCVLYNPITSKKKDDDLIFFDKKKKRIKIRTTDDSGSLTNKYEYLNYKEKIFESEEKK